MDIIKYRKEKDPYFFGYYLDSIERLGRLEELKILLDYDNNYDLSHFNEQVYTMDNIKLFGIETLVKACKHYLVLELSGWGKEHVEEFKYILNSKLCDVKICLLQDYSISELKKLNDMMDDKVIKYVFENSASKCLITTGIFSNPLLYKNIRFAIENYDCNYIQLDDDKTFNFFNSPVTTTVLNKALSIKQDREITINIMIMRIDVFTHYKDLLNDDKYFYIIIDSVLSCKPIKDINSYYEDRYKDLLDEMSETLSLDAKKENIFITIFKKRYETIKDEIKNLDILIKTGKLEEPSEYKYIKNIFEAQDEKTILDNLKYVYKFDNFFNQIKDQVKQICFEDIAKKINIVLPGKGIIRIDDGQFRFLIHKICGVGNSLIYKELQENISLWHNKDNNKVCLSTSAITDRFLGVAPKDGYMVGFSNITSEDILDEGPIDIFSSNMLYEKKLFNKNTEYLLFDELIEDTRQLYNEIVLRRINHGRILTPDYVLTFDNPNKYENEAARYFDVPVIQVNKERYLDRIEQELSNASSVTDLLKYNNALNRLFLSSYSDGELLRKYFINYCIEERISRLLKIYNNQLSNPEVSKLLLKIIDNYYSIATNLYCFEKIAEIFDKDDFVKKIKR